MAGRTGSTVRQRAPLTREKVLRAAVRLADRHGIEALSMRRLGQELGVEAMSLYNHVANKEDLLNGMVDLLVAEVDDPLTGADWRTAMRARILSARQMLLRHPWASRVIETRTTMTPAVMDYMEQMGEILRSGGFSVDLTHHAIHALGSRVLGFGQEIYGDSQALGESPGMDELMLQRVAQRYPRMTEIAQVIAHDSTSTVGAGCDDQFEFEFALDLLLDGLERLRAAGWRSG